jgi:serine/threonine-protein kinase
MIRDGELLLRERRVLDVFDQALTWAPEHRIATLHTMFADDPALIRRVERLLAAQRDAHLMRTQLPDAADAVSTPASPHAAFPGAFPERIGVYRLDAPIGEGGMGTVYRAERIEGGFEQTVAIKLIRGGLFSHAATERFAREREILARLSHPHVTRLYDGGITAGGQSYIVMELVDGPPITEYAAARGLDLHARLALFGAVCDAAGYAHQQGVVHADIKPGNVLIDSTHGVKLLDFGISALADGCETAGAGFTTAYASPQQQRGERPTPADDVFALGCLLAALTDASPGTATGTATRTLATELRAVIARACAPDPRHRYTSCSALADDVLRLRDGYPVRALPATRRRDAAFFWRRHRLATSAALAATVGLAGAVVIATTLEIRAEAARAQADQRFVEIRALSRYMLDDVTDQLQAFPGTSALRRDIATRSRAYLEGLSHLPGPPLVAGPATGTDAEPDIRLEVARGYAKTGRILGLPDVQGMGDVTAAKQDLAKAEAALRALLAASQSSAQSSATKTALAQTLSARAAIARNADNDTALALRLDQEAIRLTTPESGAAPDASRPPDPAATEQRLAQVRALTGLAEVFNDNGRPADMLAPLRAAEADLKDVPEQPNRVDRALTRAAVANLRGDAVYYLGNVPGSLALYQHAAALLDAARDAPPDIRLLERSAFTTWNIASVLDELGRKQEALAVIDRGVADAELMRQFENSTRARHVLDIVHTQRAEALASVGRFDDAIAQARTELADVRATAAASPGSFEAARSVPIVLRPVGEVYLAAGRPADACAAFAEAREAWRKLAGTEGVTGYDTATELPLLSRELRQCGDAALPPGPPHASNRAGTPTTGPAPANR